MGTAIATTSTPLEVTSATNNDDHPRNHALLQTRGGWRLSPAYDILPVPLAELMSSAVSMPSVQVDNCVSDVVVVLASNRAHAMVATASSLQATPPAM